MNYQIKAFKGHYVVMDQYGEILVHCDTYEEAKQEIKSLIE